VLGACKNQFIEVACSDLHTLQVVAVSLIKRAEKQDKWIKRAEKQDKWIKRAEKQDKWIKRAEKQDKWIKRAEKQGKWAHTFKELVSILQADPTSKTVNLTRAKIGKITRATHELLCCGSIKREVDGGFGMYSCAADPDYKLKGGLVTNVPPDGAAAECHV